MSAELVRAKEADSPASLPVPKIGYSIKEATKITGLGRTSLFYAVEAGKLRCFKVGRRVLFSLKHLEDFMASYEKK